MNKVKNHYKNARCIISGIALFLCAFMLRAQTVAVPDGYATQNGGTTGGGSASPDTVKTVAEFKAAAVGNNDTAVIIVKGRLNVGKVSIGSNKTIMGADESSGLYGGVVEVKGKNNIFQNLLFGPSGADVMEISGAKNVFITKCTFHDSQDELCSIVREADFITVSYCKFYFDNPTSHSFAHLIGNDDARTSDRGKLNVTLHHNWYSKGIRGRIPRVRFGHVHIYNNLFYDTGTNTCVATGKECHIRLESSHFEKVNKTWSDYGGSADGEMGWANLKLVGESVPTYMPNKYPVFDLPYSYTMDSVEYVKAIVTSCAGNVFNANCSDSSKHTTFFSLTTSVSGQGSISPGSASFLVGTAIAITATPSTGWKFEDWSGDLSGTNNPASLILDSNVSVTANFSQLPVEEVNTQTASLCSFYPNPVNDKLTIELHNEFSQGALIQLFDKTGRLILNKKIKESNHTLDMENLPSGMYLVKVSNNNEDLIIKRIAKL